MMTPEGLYDIYDPVYIPFYNTKLFYIIILLLFSAVVFIAIYFLIVWFKKSKKLNYWEHALKELNDISTLMHSTLHKDKKEFYFKLTHVIKDYLSKRYDIRLGDKTDLELLILFKSKSIPVKMLNLLEDILSGAMLIKFANQDAAINQMQKDLENGFFIVKNTKIEENK